MAEIIGLLLILIVIRPTIFKGSASAKPLHKHPSHKPGVHSIITKGQWNKYDNPYLGPKRKRTAKFYRSRYVSKKVRKLF